MTVEHTMLAHTAWKCSTGKVCAKCGLNRHSGTNAQHLPFLYRSSRLSSRILHHLVAYCFFEVRMISRVSQLTDFQNERHWTGHRSMTTTAAESKQHPNKRFLANVAWWY
eukprot:4580001-Amphidinium_carterae.1